MQSAASHSYRSLTHRHTLVMTLYPAGNMMRTMGFLLHLASLKVVDLSGNALCSLADTPRLDWLVDLG